MGLLLENMEIQAVIIIISLNNKEIFVCLVPVWSEVNVSGIRLCELNPNLAGCSDPENWAKIHQDVVESAYEVIKLKGYTSWAIGLSVSNICNAIFRNTQSIKVVSTHIQVNKVFKDVVVPLPYKN